MDHSMVFFVKVTKNVSLGGSSRLGTAEDFDRSRLPTSSFHAGLAMRLW
jgi:hypothetical protein